MDWQLLQRLVRGALRRRKLLAVSSALVVAMMGLPAAYYLSVQAPRFWSSATILIETRPDRVPLFQEFAPSRPLSVQMAILRSRAITDAVLEELPPAARQDLAAVPPTPTRLLTTRLSDLYHYVLGREPQADPPPDIHDVLRDSVRFNGRPDGVVELSVEAWQPEVAVDILNTYIGVLLARTRSFNVDDARVTREYLEQQVTEVRKAMQASEETLRAFNNIHGGVRIPEQSAALVARLTKAETDLAEVQANRRILETRLAGLREKLEEQRRAPPAPRAPAPSAPPPSVRRLRDQLERLEASLLDLRVQYTEHHPRIVALKDRVAQVHRLLAGAVKESTSVTPSPDAVPPEERVNFAEQVLAVETSLHAVGAQEQAIRRQVEAFRQSLTGLSGGELAYSRLGREVESNQKVYALLADKLTAARIREQGEMRVVKVIDPPGRPVTVSSARRFKLTGMGLFFALAAGLAVPLAAEFVYRRVETEDDVHAATNLPVLAMIPRVRARRPLILDVHRAGDIKFADRLLFSEAFGSLRVAIQLAARSDAIRTVLIASALPGDGKSTVLVNLAFAFNQVGTKVAVFDTDFFRPTLHRTFGVHSTAGFGDALEARRPIEDSLVQTPEGIWLAAPSQPVPLAARSALAGTRLKELVEGMTPKGEIVLFDSAPLLAVPETLFLAGVVDAVILIARAGSTGCRELARAKSMLDSVGARTLGVVINQMPPASLRRQYRRYYAGYYDRHDGGGLPIGASGTRKSRGHAASGTPAPASSQGDTHVPSETPRRPDVHA